MSVKQVTQILCDRCGKLVESAEDAKADALTNRVQVPHPLVYAEGSLLTDTTKIHFDDLCAKCVVRVQSLLGQIRLDDVQKDEVPKTGDGKPNVGDNPAAAQKPKTPTKDAAPASAKH